jgi:hypothetical protein
LPQGSGGTGAIEIMQLDTAQSVARTNTALLRSPEAVA